MNLRCYQHCYGYTCFPRGLTVLLSFQLTIFRVGRDLNPRLSTPTGSHLPNTRNPCTSVHVPSHGLLLPPSHPPPVLHCLQVRPSTHCPHCSTTDLELKSHHITPIPKPSMAPTAHIRTNPKLQIAERSPMKTWSLLTSPNLPGI